jgi:5-methylcytosine-specific restriction endonuclease McrA
VTARKSTAGPTAPAPLETAIRRRARQALSDHRKRAAADFRRLDYGRLQLEALLRSSPCCGHCGTPTDPSAAAIDHRTPTARGGTHTLGNLLVCCQVCNERKGALTEEEYRQLLALVRTWHPRAGADVLARLRAGGRRYAGGRGKRSCGT